MTYTLNKKVVTIEEFENVEVFGISVYVNDTMVMKVEDISSEKQFVECVLNKFIEYSVSIFHVIDVIEDEIFEHVG